MAEKLTVLVVDDEPTIVALLRDFLEAEDFGVETAASGQQARAAVEEGPVDCVLLDVMMPDLSGFDVCRRIRERSDMPLLFLSARDGDIDKIRGLGLGGDDYIVKSATPGEVVARVLGEERQQLEFARSEFYRRTIHTHLVRTQVQRQPAEVEHCR